MTIMRDELARRFPETYIYWTFVISFFVTIAQTWLMFYLIRDALRHRRSEGYRTRVAVVMMISGSYAWRVYSVAALWHYNWNNVPKIRLMVDSWMALTLIVFAYLWLGGRRRII